MLLTCCRLCKESKLKLKNKKHFRVRLYIILFARNDYENAANFKDEYCEFTIPSLTFKKNVFSVNDDANDDVTSDSDSLSLRSILFRRVAALVVMVAILCAAIAVRILV